MTRCPRCNSRLIRNHDELSCLTHGLMVDPSRAHDLIEEPGPQSQRPIAPNAGRPWTNEDRAYLLAHKDTKAAKDIAAWLNRTERGVHHYASKLRIPKVRVDAALKPTTLPKNVSDEIEDTARPGALADVARHHGLKYQAAWQRLYRRGVRLRSADGMMSKGEIMREYQCTWRRVDLLIRKGILKAHRSGKNGVAIRIDPPTPRAERLLRIRVPARGGRR